MINENYISLFTKKEVIFLLLLLNFERDCLLLHQRIIEYKLELFDEVINRNNLTGAIKQGSD